MKWKTTNSRKNTDILFFSFLQREIKTYKASNWCGCFWSKEDETVGWHHWLDGVWVNSGSWCCTGRPGMLQFMGSQRVRHDCATEQSLPAADPSQLPAHPPTLVTGRWSQPEPEGGSRGPREASSTNLQAGFIANQFLGFIQPGISHDVLCI